jgi:hypothetical protein
MELEAVYGHLNVHDGKRLEGAPPGVLVETQSPSARTARGRDRDTLLVHLTLTSRETPPAALYQNVLEALVEAFYLSSGSVTAALRKAIRAANEYLMRHNIRMEGIDKQHGGITCAVLREEEVFIAQAGPALAFIAHQGQLERLPPRPPGDASPLGISYGVDTRFYHSWVHPGDVLLLAEPSFERHSDQAVGSAVIYEGISTGINNLAKMMGNDRHARLLLVEFSADRLRRPPPPGRAATADEVVKPSVPEAILTPMPPAEGPPEPDRPAGQPADTPPRSAARIDVGEGVRKAASGLALGVARVIGGVGQVLGRLFSEGAAEGQAVKKDRGPSPVALATLAVLIPIVVGLIVVAVYTQRGRAEQFLELLVEMEQESLLAQDAAGDPAAARAHWERVMEMSDEALRLRPAHDVVLQFRRQSRDALDVLDEVTRLAVHSLYKYQGQGGTPSALTVQSLAVYVLDDGVDYVYKHLLESDLQPVGEIGPETLLFKQQAVGGDAIGELVDLIWFPRSGEIREDTVAILDSSGLLLNYRPSWGDVLSLQLRTPAAWSNPVAMAVYGDNLYVLDVGAGEVWKFNAQDGGYPDEPTAYRFDLNEDGNPTNDVALAEMVDMTIDRDGNLYLLKSDGEVFKFFGGERKPFLLADLKEPLVAPTAIFCSLIGLNPFCYIADPGSGRIVQVTPQGLFWAQYRAKGADLADPFAQIRDIYVHEMPLLLIYATSGDNLLVAALE